MLTTEQLQIDHAGTVREEERGVASVPAGRHDRVRDRGAFPRRGVPRAARARVGAVPVHGGDLGADAGAAPLRTAEHAGDESRQHRSGRRQTVQGTRPDPDHGRARTIAASATSWASIWCRTRRARSVRTSRSESPGCSGRRRGSTSWPTGRPPTRFARLPGASTAASTVWRSERSSTPSARTVLGVTAAPLPRDAERGAPVSVSPDEPVFERGFEVIRALVPPRAQRKKTAPARRKKTAPARTKPRQSKSGARKAKTGGRVKTRKAATPRRKKSR